MGLLNSREVLAYTFGNSHIAGRNFSCRSQILSVRLVGSLLGTRVCVRLGLRRAVQERWVFCTGVLVEGIEDCD